MKTIGSFLLSSAICILTFFAAVQEATAATYYMATTGSDSAGDGSMKNPWRSLNYANKQLRPGDTLYIRGGIYYEKDISLAASGTAGSIVTIAAYPGEKPHFQPAGGLGGDFVRWYTAKNYLTFDGIEVSGYSHSAFGAGYGKGITIRNCYMHDINPNGSGAIFTGYYGSTTDVIIENNIFKNIGVDTKQHGIYTSRYSSNITIRGNLFLGPIAGYGVHVYSGASPYPANVRIYNNVFYLGTGSRRVPIIIASGSGHEIYNNTIHVYAAGASLATHIRINPSATVAAIKNNIFYGDDNAGYIYNNSGTIMAIDYNLYWPKAKDTDDKGTHSFQGDPGFVNTSARDYRLQSSSKAIDAGTTVGIVTKDLNGVSRPQGQAYDIGAYESAGVVQTTGSSIPLDTTPSIPPKSMPPVVTAFSIPPTSSSLTVPIFTLTASDDVGVTGYLVTESSAAPSATSGGWSTAAPTSFKFNSAGTKTLHSWAKDGDGQVSMAKGAIVSIEQSTAVSMEPSDTMPPTAPSGLTVSLINGLKANLLWQASSDNVGVTGYLIFRDGVQVGETSLTNYTDNISIFDIRLSYSYTVKAKDASGNVSQPSNTASVYIQKDRGSIKHNFK